MRISDWSSDVCSSDLGIKVRITVKAADEAAAQRMLAAEEALVRGLLGDVIFGIDEQSMETVVIEQLRREGRTLAARKSVVSGKSVSVRVDLGGRRFIKKKN